MFLLSSIENKRNSLNDSTYELMEELEMTPKRKQMI